MDIEQGNIITPQIASQLHPGMSEAQVQSIMGAPLLINTFTVNQMNYVYTFKPGYGTLQEKRITLIFKAGRLARIES
jgi:outer membrane protein assembly factor BamE